MLVDVGWHTNAINNTKVTMITDVRTAGYVDLILYSWKV